MFEGHHYQNAYICRDIEKAVADFTARADVRKIIQYEGDNPLITPNGPAMVYNKMAFIWVGDMQYELIQPVSGDIPLYLEAAPADDSLFFHHICTRIYDWDDFRARVDKQSLPICIERSDDPALKFLYLDARPIVGHYLEYVWMSDERWGQMGGV